MKTYEYTKEDGTRWLFYYDRWIRLWTIYEIDSEGHQLIDTEADHFHDRKQLVDYHGVNFKTVYKD